MNEVEHYAKSLSHLIVQDITYCSSAVDCFLGLTFLLFVFHLSSFLKCFKDTQLTMLRHAMFSANSLLGITLFLQKYYLCLSSLFVFIAATEKSGNKLCLFVTGCQKPSLLRYNLIIRYKKITRKSGCLAVKSIEMRVSQQFSTVLHLCCRFFQQEIDHICTTFHHIRYILPQKGNRRRLQLGGH